MSLETLRLDCELTDGDQLVARDFGKNVEIAVRDTKAGGEESIILSRKKAGLLLLWLTNYLEQPDPPLAVGDVVTAHCGDEKWDIIAIHDGFAWIRRQGYTTLITKELEHLERVK